jgi:hypothetical protein
MKHHHFRMRDPGGPPMGLGRLSPRDEWRYQQSLARFRARRGEPEPVLRGEVGLILGFRFKSCPAAPPQNQSREQSS